MGYVVRWVCVVFVFLGMVVECVCVCVGRRKVGLGFCSWKLGIGRSGFGEV